MDNNGVERVGLVFFGPLARVSQLSAPTLIRIPSGNSRYAMYWYAPVGAPPSVCGGTSSRRTRTRLRSDCGNSWHSEASRSPDNIAAQVVSA